MTQHKNPEIELIGVSDLLPKPARDALVKASEEALCMKDMDKARHLQAAIDGVKTVYPKYFRA